MKLKVCFVFLMALSLLSCDSPQESTSRETSSSSVIELRFGHDMHEKSAHHLAAIRFAELVAQKTQGSVLIKVFANQSLGSDLEMIDAAQNGKLDIILPPTAKLSFIIPEMQMFDLPFIFPNRQIAYKILDGSVGNRLLQKTKPYNLIGLAFWESGFKQLTSNFPIEKAADFSGKRFRIMQSPVLRDQFQLWGADAIVINFSATYDALKNKIADGQENPLTSIIGKKFYQVQSHLTLSDHGYLAQLLAISSQSFSKLDDQLQQVIIEAAKEATEYQRQVSTQQHHELLTSLQQEPIQINEMDKRTRLELIKMSDHLIEKYRMTFGSSLVEDLLQQRSNVLPPPKENLIIALDADMQGNSAFSGLAIRRGIELAIDEINQQGGLLDKQLSLVVRDNSMIPAKGLDNLATFIRHPNLIGVFCGISSPVAVAELKFIHDNQILFLNPWAAATPIVDNGYQPNFVFRVSLRDEFAGRVLLQEALKISNKIGLLLVNNPWGRSSHKAITEQLAKQDLQTLKTEWFDWGEESFSQQIAAFKQKEVEVIIYVGNPVEGAKLVHDLAKSDTPPPIISHWGITGSEFPKMASPSLDKIDLRVLQTFSFINNSRAQANQLAKRYHQRYFTQNDLQIVAPVGTAHAYDLTHLLALAVKQANSHHMNDIRVAMESIKHFNGVVKNYAPPFTPQRHDALNSQDVIFAHYKNGQLIPLPSNQK
ncbi:DctP family TRAP transporter solute-binding subunit [Aliikangiella maris]|uniref:DctP family TRAP transporter solute-binding subunit n=2 Tax=Aliikangiella maris TaxID=3162458 RepID=A0ABV3MSM0_9GAMM